MMQEPTFYEMLQWGWTIISAVIGWVLKSMWDAQKEMKDDLVRLRENLPREYVAKVDLAPALNDIKLVLARIEDKVDRKVDKA